MNKTIQIHYGDILEFFSDTFNEVQQQSEFYWRQIQTTFFEEYSIKTVFPIHLQLLALPGIISAILWFCYSYLRGELSQEEELNHRPMIVRGIKYN